jgi:hypothetical protein
VRVRGVYGGFPQELIDSGRSLAGCGINAVWIGSGSLTPELAARIRDEGCLVFAEFNTLHHAGFLEKDPDAAPRGPDGKVCPPPDGWQGVCPSHPGYRRERMEAFERVLAASGPDGVWLDYHHAHASWEQAQPNLPDTCFCPLCLDGFREEAGVDLPRAAAAASARLLGPLKEQWTRWRCNLLTGWVREFAAVRDRVRPGALLGTFHCPWTDQERGGALKRKLAIDLAAQAEFVDVFSPMPYHARFGHAKDPEWISRQTAWLHEYLQRNASGLAREIWPIVQLSHWGEPVPAEQVETVLDHGSRPPSTGVMAFNWGGLRGLPANIEAMVSFYRRIA